MKKYIISSKAKCVLKRQIVYLLNNYSDEIYGHYEIYLYNNYLKIKYNKKKIFVAVVEFNNELFWLLTPFYNSYLLIKFKDYKSFAIILNIIKLISKL